MDEIKEDPNFTWVDPTVVPDASHLLHLSNVWCVVNDQDHILIYKMGTKESDANSPICNRNKDIVKRLFPAYEQYGAVDVKLIPHLFLPDSPGRY